MNVIAGSTGIAVADGRESAGEGPGPSHGRQRGDIEPAPGDDDTTVTGASAPAPGAAASAAGTAGRASAAVSELHQRHLFAGKGSSCHLPPQLISTRHVIMAL